MKEPKPFQDCVAPSETRESIRLPDIESLLASGILEHGNDASAVLPAHCHLITSHELLASPIAGSVPSGNR
jgi:hypothetical protein